jgi:hypothetical protein
MKSTVTGLSLCALLWVSSCGGEGGPSEPLLGSCNLPSIRNCADYFGSAQAGMGLDSGCAALRGTWSTGTCNPTMHCGTCTNANAQGLVSKTYFFENGDSEASLQSSCTGGAGTWTDNPAVTCGGGATGATVTGTVTLASPVTNRCLMVAIDTDTSGSNLFARRTDGSYLVSYQKVSSATASFSIERVPSGTYYLWAYLDADSSSSSPAGNCEIMGAPTSGDQFGYYNSGLMEPPAPNVQSTSGTSTFDFQLGVIP